MRRAALLMLLSLAHAKLHFSGRRARAGAHNHLVDSLRRQLMHDNYDYMTSASDELLAPAPAHYDAVDAGPPADEGDYFPEPSPARPRPDRLRANSLLPHAHSRRQRTRKELSVEEETPPPLPPPPPPPAPPVEVPYQRVESNVPVSHKDLYYYVDDARLNGGAGDALAFNVLDVADAPDNEDFDDEAAAPTRKKKYTILEIEGGGEARRSGSGGRRRFVQEEGADGIAIVSLDNGPFPEFRLPTDRRQYMHHEYPDDPLNLPLNAPPQPRHPLPHHSLEHAQQEDDLLYLS